MCSLSREAYIKSLVEMYEAKPCDASMDNPRCDVLFRGARSTRCFRRSLLSGRNLPSWSAGTVPPR